MDETGAHYIDKDILFQTPFHYGLLQVLDSCAHLDFYLLTPRVAGFYNSNSCSPHWKTTELKKSFENPPFLYMGNQLLLSRSNVSRLPALTEEWKSVLHVRQLSPVPSVCIPDTDSCTPGGQRSGREPQA